MLLFMTNEHCDGYTIHHCPSPMTLHHARQPPVHLSAKWLASLWLSGAAIMIIYFPTTLLFPSPYFPPSCFNPKHSNLQRVKQRDPSWCTWVHRWKMSQLLMSSQTFLPKRFQTSPFPIKQRAIFKAVSPRSPTDSNTLTLNFRPPENEQAKSWIWTKKDQVEKI